jgi:hypothetical protein
MTTMINSNIILARLVLQSNLYQDDPDIREAVDAVLALDGYPEGIKELVKAVKEVYRELDERYDDGTYPPFRWLLEPLKTLRSTLEKVKT